MSDKHTHELAAGDVVAVRPKPIPVAGGLLEHRWDRTTPPSRRSGRWLTVTEVLPIDEGYARVYFGEGNFAVCPTHNAAWYVLDPKETP